MPILRVHLSNGGVDSVEQYSEIHFQSILLSIVKVYKVVRQCDQTGIIDWYFAFANVQQLLRKRRCGKIILQLDSHVDGKSQPLNMSP